MVIGTRDEKPDLPPESPADYPSAGEIGGYLMDTIFMDRLNADLARLKRINKTLELVPEEKRSQAGLININSLVIKPSKDLRYVTQAHVRDIPRSVQVLLRTLGGWGTGLAYGQLPAIRIRLLRRVNRSWLCRWNERGTGNSAFLKD